MSTSFLSPRILPSGRPEQGEYAPYAEADLQHVEGDDAIDALTALRASTLALIAALDEDAVRGLRYAPGKWTVKEVLVHLIDDERIFAYRALCCARGDKTSLPGFEENDYVATSGAESRSLASLAAEYAAVRDATLTLLEGLPAEGWTRRGVTNGYSASARGLAFHIAAHELHHLRTLHERYGIGAPPSRVIPSAARNPEA